MSAPAIEVDRLAKRYRIGMGPAKSDTVAGKLLSPFRYLRKALSKAGEDELVWAVKNVSFKVDFGEVVGIIGRNGAGKTTMLRMLTRITDPTEGEAVLRGRVGALLAVGTGFHPDLTGRENIYLNGAILGLKRAEVEARFDQMVEYAEVGKFVDTPVKYYSSGMQVRLAFSVAAHLDPEILLIDEVLAVGDLAFQKKCLGKMNSVAQEGRTVLLVSHNMDAILGLCPRTIWMEAGEIKADGPTEEVVRAYSDFCLNRTREQRNLLEDKREGTGVVRITGFGVRDIMGGPLNVIPVGTPVDLFMPFVCQNPGQQNVEVRVWIRDRMGRALIFLNNEQTAEKFEGLPAKGEFICRIPRLSLMPGPYQLDMAVFVNGIRADRIIDAAVLEVAPQRLFRDRPGPPGQGRLFDRSLLAHGGHRRRSRARGRLSRAGRGLLTNPADLTKLTHMPPCRIYITDLVHNHAAKGPFMFPLNAGYLAAYAKKRFGRAVETRIFKFPGDFMAAVEEAPPHIAGFGNYTWNLQINRKLAAWLKAKDPNIVTVFGGPDFPIVPKEARQYVASRPMVDFFVLHQGEPGLANLIERYMAAGSPEAMKKELLPNCVFKDPGGRRDGRPRRDRLHRGSGRDSLALFERRAGPLFHRRAHSRSLKPTGAAPTAAPTAPGGRRPQRKVYQFPLKRVEEELDYIAAQPKNAGLLMVGDANFGIFARDVEIARHLRNIKDRTGYPSYVEIAWAKKTPDRIQEMAELLKEMASVTCSFQTLDPKVMANIQRTNLSFEQFKKIQAHFLRPGGAQPHRTHPGPARRKPGKPIWTACARCSTRTSGSSSATTCACWTAASWPPGRAAKNTGRRPNTAWWTAASGNTGTSRPSSTRRWS